MDPALDKASSYPSGPPPSQGGPPPGAGAPPYRLRVLKEPRGFLRCIEFVLAVCMFATTAGYDTHYSFRAACHQGGGTPLVVPVSYPFRLESKPLPSLCNDTTQHYAQADPASSAEFFVAVGVLAMLYTIGALVWYILFEVKYVDNGIHFVIDLVVTCVFVLLFFISSCAWAAGLNDVKYWTNFDNLMKRPDGYQTVCSNPASHCEAVDRANYASLNVSVIFGFLNSVVWGGNIWFIYKETDWFKRRSQQHAPPSSGGGPGTDVFNPNKV